MKKTRKTFKALDKARFKAKKKLAKAQAKREKWEPEYKYKVPQLGDHGSSTMNVDDTNA